MSKRLLIHFIILISTSTLFCSSFEIPLLDYINRCDLIIQGELTHIDHYTGEVTLENINSLRDTAYILINKVYKSKSDISNLSKENVKLILPPKNRTTKDGITMDNSAYIFYEVGQNGIWLLTERDNAYTANHYQALQSNSKDALIQKLCEIDPQIIDFLNSVSHLNNYRVKRYFKLAKINPNDSIFSYNETNPILIAVRQRKTNLIQLLIDYGFNLNFKNENGENALFIALKRSINDLGIIEILLKNNIETDIINKGGVSIYDLVNKKKNKEEILELFQKYKEWECL